MASKKTFQGANRPLITKLISDSVCKCACIFDWVSYMPTCSHTDSHLHRVLMSLLVGSYHTFSVNLLSVPAACGLEIQGYVAKRQVHILFSLVCHGEEGGWGLWNRYRLSLQTAQTLTCDCVHTQQIHAYKQTLHTGSSYNWEFNSDNAAR